MEKNHYEFFSYNPSTAERKLIYDGWYAEDEMIMLSKGMLLGLHQFRAKLVVCVYLCKEDGTKDFVHEARTLRLSRKRGFI